MAISRAGRRRDGEVYDFRGHFRKLRKSKGKGAEDMIERGPVE